MIRVRKLLVLLSIVVIIFILSGCSNGNQKKENLLKEKVVQELEYVDVQIISMLNKLNNINFENYTVGRKEVTLEKNQEADTKSEEEASSVESSSGKTENKEDTIYMTSMEPDTILITDSNDIDWITLKKDIEILNSSWSVIILDLYSLGLNNNDILAFSTVLDNCIISISNENKKDSLTNLSELYSFIPMYLSGIPDKVSKKNVVQTKAYIISSYAFVEQDKWDEIGTAISEADSQFKTVMSDVKYAREKEYRVNQAYVLLKELQQSINTKDHKLFYMKYKNVMESMNVL